MIHSLHSKGALVRMIWLSQVHVAYQTSGNVAVSDEEALRFAEFAASVASPLDVTRAAVEKDLISKRPGEVRLLGLFNFVGSDLHIWGCFLVLIESHWVSHVYMIDISFQRKIDSSNFAQGRIGTQDILCLFCSNLGRETMGSWKSERCTLPL